MNITPDAETGNINATRCNCTFCQKLAYTGLQIKNPDSDFKLISPASKAELGDYKGGSIEGHRYFCKDCSVLCWQEGAYEFEGKKVEFFGFNLATVDQPQDGFDLNQVKLKYYDGLHDNWYAELKETPYPGGLP